MTIKEVSTSLYNLSVGGVFNGEKFTASQFDRLIANYFREGVQLTLGNRGQKQGNAPKGEKNEKHD